jgi:uncharacterized cofD-like protein
MKNIVVLGGGTGTYTVLTGLKRHTANLTAIVTMADSGGSTGRLRDEQGVLPPGDIRRALAALSESDELTRELFAYRFEGDRFGKDGGVSGHTVGNLLIAALEKITGSFEAAVAQAGKMLNVRGSVVPVTTTDTQLEATLADGTKILGEDKLWGEGSRITSPIKKLALRPQAEPTVAALHAIERADLIVIGPGALFSSIIPLMLVDRIPEAIKLSAAKKVYVANLMTEPPATEGYKVIDLVDRLEEYLGKDVLDYVIFNDHQPSAAMAKRYAEQGSHPVEWTKADFAGRSWRPIPADLGSAADFWRHDSDKVARLLLTVGELQNVLAFTGTLDGQTDHPKPKPARAKPTRDKKE